MSNIESIFNGLINGVMLALLADRLNLTGFRWRWWLLIIGGALVLTIIRHLITNLT